MIRCAPEVTPQSPSPGEDVREETRQAALRCRRPIFPKCTSRFRYPHLADALPGSPRYLVHVCSFDGQYRPPLGSIWPPRTVVKFLLSAIYAHHRLSQQRPLPRPAQLSWKNCGVFRTPQGCSRGSRCALRNSPA